MGKSRNKNNGNTPKRKGGNSVEKNKKTPTSKKKEKIIDVKEEIEEVIEEDVEELDDIEEEEKKETENEDWNDDWNNDNDEDHDDDFDDDEEDEDLDDDKELDEEDNDNDEDFDDDEEEDNEEELDEEDDDNDDDEEDNEEELDEEDDNNDEDFDDDEEENITDIEEEKNNKSKSKKETKKEEKVIIKEVKPKKEKKKKQSSKLSNTLLAIDSHRYTILAFAIGVIITILVGLLIWPERIATLKDGTQPIVKIDGKTYTANKLYEDMKQHYQVSLLLDEIDTDLLNKLYKEDDAMTKKVAENAEYYLNMYKQYYGYSQEEFLEKNGFANYEAFLDYLRLDYRRSKYLDEYIEKNIKDEEIKKYYDENVFGDINTQHVLVEVSSSEDDKKLSDEDAKKLAEEIITKINDGTTWETIKTEYKDKVTFEDLSYQSWDASLEDSFMKALKEMEDNSFSKEPVKTSYGYHVIYRLDQKEKPKLKDAKKTIISKLSAEKKSSDSNLLYKALISLRKEKKIKFSDTDMEARYKAYCNQYQ